MLFRMKKPSACFSSTYTIDEEIETNPNVDLPKVTSRGTGNGGRELSFRPSDFRSSIPKNLYMTCCCLQMLSWRKSTSDCPLPRTVISKTDLLTSQNPFISITFTRSSLLPFSPKFSVQEAHPQRVCVAPRVQMRKYRCRRARCL